MNQNETNDHNLKKEVSSKIPEQARKEAVKSLPEKSKTNFRMGSMLLCIGLIAGGFLGLQLDTNSQCPEGIVKGEATEIGDKTWVPYDEPLVEMTVLEDKDCEECNFDEIIKQIKQGLVPTLSIYKIDISSEQGKGLIEKFNIKSLPAFIFDERIEKITNFDQMSKIFNKKESMYSLNTGMVQIKPVKYLESIQINTDDAQRGPKDALITIIEVSEFQCPYCKKASNTMEQVFNTYPGKIKHVFKHMPLDFHQKAQKAAEASECAREQGKFWEMHDMLFENQKNLEISDLKEYAKDLNLDAKKFNSCLDSGKYVDKIKAQTKEAQDFGVSGTPGFFINDHFLGGAYPIEEFTKIIDGILGE